jgi:hypothetical protein
VTPGLVPQLIKNAQALQTTFDNTIKQRKADNETTTAKATELTAQTGQQTVTLQGREYHAIQTEDGYKLVPKYGPASGSGPGSAPPIVTVPDSGRPRTPAETQAKAHLDQATAAHARLQQFEDTLATDPAHPTTPDLTRIVPSLSEDTLAHGGRKVGTALGGTVGGVLGGVGGWVAGGPMGAAGGAAGGAYVGGSLGDTLNTVGNTLLSKERQQYNNEQLNFVAAVRGEETSRITPEVFAIERERFFPKPGDTEAEVLRKRQVREEALSGLATQTNRRQGSVPVGQKRVEEGGPRVVTMAELRAAASEKGKTLDEAMAAALRLGWRIK